MIEYAGKYGKAVFIKEIPSSDYNSSVTDRRIICFSNKDTFLYPALPKNHSKCNSTPIDIFHSLC